MVLFINSWLKGFQYPYWIGFVQAKEMGGHVKKNEKSTRVIFFKVKEIEEMKKNEKGEMEKVITGIPIFSDRFVWNIQQTEGIEIPAEIKENSPGNIKELRVQKIEDFFKTVTIKHGPIPMYCDDSKDDFIAMPQKSDFSSLDEFYAALFRMGIRTTSHPSRLNRNYKHDNGKLIEEICCEIGAAYLLSICGFQVKVDNRAAYIQRLLQELEKNPTSRVFSFACSQAEKAVKYILNEDDLTNLQERKKKNTDNAVIVPVQNAAPAAENEIKEEKEKTENPDPEAVRAYQERRQRRIEKYQYRTGNAQQEADNRFKTADNIVKCIPPGQPILVGHHSEGRHRNALKRHDNNMRKGFEAKEKSEYWQDRAKAAEKNTAVYSDDPEALIKLETKVKNLESQRDMMKLFNKAMRMLRKNPSLTAEDLGISQKSFDKLKANIDAKHDYLDKPWMPFDSYQFQNIGQNIRASKERIESLKKQSEREHKEIPFDGGTMVHNVDENRLQLIFDGKPAEEIRTDLKSHGFRWSPSNKAWQRQLTHNAEWNAEIVLARVSYLFFFSTAYVFQ
jgi:antirestriction protein ArdC